MEGAGDMADGEEALSGAAQLRMRGQVQQGPVETRLRLSHTSETRDGPFPYRDGTL